MLFSNPVGRTQKTSFPLSSNSKASLMTATILKQLHFLREQIQAINIRHFTAKVLGIHHGTEYLE